MELLLIRHALPVRRELIEGIADPELSELGHAQSTHLASYLEGESVDAVYTSPLRRAVQTAQPITATRGLTPVIRDGLAEWDRTANEYVPVEELRATNDPRWHALISGDWDGEEDRDVFRERVRSTVEQLIADHSGQRIAVVCHGGVINSYLADVLSVELRGNGFFYPNYTSIHRVAAASNGTRTVITINETAHLRGTGLPMGLFQGPDNP